MHRSGSWGSIPRAILDKRRDYQDAIEARPDYVIRYEHGKLTDESREAVATIVNAPVETITFVNNATEGINTVFKNIKWNKDGKDVVLYFTTIYDACGKTIDFLYDFHGEGKFSSREIKISYPIEDEDILQRFRDAVKQVEAEGNRARICIFDSISSNPGLVFPWEAMIKACRELGVLSLVDGAQGIGMIPLNLSEADPDFFVSNCHKWLFAPRGCAVFYVPVRNQHLLPSTLSTSHGYIPETGTRAAPPVIYDSKSFFINNFQWTATKDYTPNYCVKDAIAYRKEVLGGEERIMNYLWDLENSKGTLTNCSMANIALPVWKGEKGPEAKEAEIVVPVGDSGLVVAWLMRTLADEYKTIVPMFYLGNRLWFRTSAQIYLDLADYEYLAESLKKLSERVRKGEYKGFKPDW
jgi:selenocysteine lyase/cysteine desulfurase